MLRFGELKKLARASAGEGKPLRIALLGDSATQLLATAMRGTFVHRNLNVSLFEADYNQVEMQLLNPSSQLHAFDPEIVILFQSSHKLLLEHAARPFAQKAMLAADRLSFIESTAGLPWMKGRKLIVFNYPEADDAVFGSYANKVPQSFAWQVRKLNCGLMDLASDCPDLYICDLDSLQAKYGRDRLFPANLYVSTDMVLSLDMLPLAAARAADIICALKGTFKKCLVLDLDNTLWGGVIGEDGLEGIQLGHGLGIGKAFTECQLWVKKLRERGIIVCVVSKNDEAVAKGPFTGHPDMVLSLEDIAVFIANWETKAYNIAVLQKILNIGFDAMVFLDDSPFERNIVRQGIPEITVPELPEDPADRLEYLYSLNLFETLSFSTTDADRTRMYREEAGRMAFSRTFANEDEYLASLGMVSDVSGFNAFNTPRVAQLTQRSNQFNLRTVRYSEGDISTLAADPSNICLALTLQDRFGDNGLVAVAILKATDDETLFIDTWLMSCRVLKRGMEAFTLNCMVSAALAAGFSKIVGAYIPTPKNAMVAGLYPSLGFEALGDGRYGLDAKSYTPLPCHITIKDK